MCNDFVFVGNRMGIVWSTLVILQETTHCMFCQDRQMTMGKAHHHGIRIELKTTSFLNHQFILRNCLGQFQIPVYSKSPLRVFLLSIADIVTSYLL